MSSTQQATEVLLQGASRLSLKTAWLLYTNGKESFVTQNHVHDVAGRPQIGAGKPATVDGVRSALASLEGRDCVPAYLPEEVLCNADHLLVWWRPPCTKRVFLLRNDGQAQTPRRADIKLPALVYAVGQEAGFSIYAIKGATRPLAKDPLYFPPLFNVFHHADVCMGNVHAPRQRDIAAIAHWEEAFWNSSFTHANVQKMLKRRGDLNGYWDACADKKIRKFDEKWLVPLRLTVEKMIQQRGSR